MPLLKIIIASTRPGRVGRNIGDWLARHAVEHSGFTVEIVDLAEVGLPFLDEPEHPATGNYLHRHSKEWSATIGEADVFVFVMPEYNYAFSAPLKNAIDFLYHEWRYKPVGFVSYGGMSGGLRAVQMMKQVVTTLRMVPAGEAVTVFTRRQLDADGRLVVDDDLSASATGMLDELGRLTQAMTAMRSAS
jgi:NAD(P)H-dependent FMN reductase